MPARLYNKQSAFFILGVRFIDEMEGFYAYNNKRTTK